jgi:hypothetical protein
MNSDTFHIIISAIPNRHPTATAQAADGCHLTAGGRGASSTA